MQTPKAETLNLVPTHPIFSRFRPFRGVRRHGEMVDFLGMRIAVRWSDLDPQFFPHQDDVTAPTPQPDEDYFEWIDLLEAVEAAQDRFVMVELGAGFGKWGVRGGLAARACGVSDIEIRFVEPEPQHATWLHDSLQMNLPDGVVTRVFEAAIDYQDPFAPLVVRGASGDARTWYGQNIWRTALQETDGLYFGHRIYRSPAHDHIHVPTVTLEDVLEGLDRVDLLDADLQGAELALVSRSMAVMTEKVTRVHLATHGAEHHDRVGQAFAEAGWLPIHAYAPQQIHDTPYGRVRFDCGVQSWRNPRLTAEPALPDVTSGADLPPISVDVPAGFVLDYGGALTRVTSVPGWMRAPGSDLRRQQSTPTAVAGEDSLEFADVVAAVQAAADSFTMIELGAGWGRWLGNAAGVLRRLRPDLPFHLVGVEAEPDHFLWMQQHFRDNGLRPEDHTLIEAAVAPAGGEVWFGVGAPQEWWGGTIAHEGADWTFDGFPEARAVRRPAVTLAAVLEPLGVVDLIDMDIQGSELDVLRAAFEAVDRQVKRLHIGTHLPEIEHGLRDLFGGAGWTLVNDHPCGSIVETNSGWIPFEDGVQTWVNPKLA